MRSGPIKKYAENMRKYAEICGKYVENMRSIFGRNGLSNFARPKCGDQNLEANKKFTTTENKTHEMMIRSWGKKVLSFTSRKKKPSIIEFSQLENLFATIHQSRVTKFQKISVKFSIGKK